MRMKFDFRHTLSPFQRPEDIILLRVKWKLPLSYLSDVIVYANSVEEHHEYVWIVMQLLYDAEVTLRLRKCFDFQELIDYL